MEDKKIITIMITTEKLTELRDRAYRAACDKGFHDEQKPDAVWKMLIITEIAEVVRLDGLGRRVRINPQDSYLYTEYLRKGYTEEDIYVRMALGNMEDKLADVIILMLDYCGMKYEKEFPNIVNYKDCFFQRSICETMYELVCRLCSRDDRDIPSIIVGLMENLILYGIDILWFVEMKMRYNETRERMHGRKY